MQVPEAASDWSSLGNFSQIPRPPPRWPPEWSLVLLIKDTARRHFASLPLFTVNSLVPLDSPCFQMKCVFDR